ncbi:MAG: hypothetical protein WED04_08380 [Promethearchaeati archaeon SRVP18_Atabeyarchaeia-1]
MQPEILITFGVMTAEKLSEVYGGVFSNLVRDAVVSFVSDEVGEDPPRVKDLQEAADYVRSRLDKYPLGHCAFWYGIGKAESVLQGAAGPASRLYLRDVVKRLTELDGVGGLVGKGDNTTAALEAFKKVATSIELLDENSYNCRGDESSSELQIRDCPNGDGCRKLISEGIMRVGSKKPLCTISLGSAVTAEVVTNIAHDYEIIELKPPNCVAKIFRP